jgi:hypothetical protein
MRYRLTASFLLALAMAATVQAQPSDGAARDVRCMLVTTHFSKAVKDPKLTPLMSLASSFYLGRVDRAVPAADLDRAIRAQAAGITSANAVPLARDCANYMVQRAEAVQRIGQSLSQTR